MRRARVFGVVLLLPLLLGLRAPVLHSPHDQIVAWAISPDFATDHTLYLALPRFNLLLRSTDAGGSFRPVNAGLDTAYVKHLAISPEFKRDRTLFCVEIGGLYVTRDAGERWERATVPPQMKNPTLAIFSPRWVGDETVVVATARDGLWATRDAGSSWERIPLPVNDPVTSMHWSPDGNLLALAGNTVLHSADDAGSFQVLSSPPGTAQTVLAADAYGFD
ncbi:MAG: WD40/YVTN/BNR-like repeat-containing protein, partial [Planctomycetota bacterium]